VTSVVQHRVRTGDGITLAAEYYPHDGDRPVVFLLHGGGQNRHAWTTSARRLQSRGYSVVAYDTRGHGDSDWDPAGRYDVERLATDLLAVRDHFSANTPPAVVGASLGGMTALGAHLLASGASWAAVILVDVTPRLEFEGARRVVTFMAAHPDGFATLGDAAEVIAAYNPHRARPENLDGLHKVLRQRPDGRWVWRWDPAFVHSNFDFLRDALPGATQQPFVYKGVDQARNGLYVAALSFQHRVQLGLLAPAPQRFLEILVEKNELQHEALAQLLLVRIET